MELKALLKNPDFVRKLAEAESEEAALALLRSEGVETTMQELAEAVMPQGELDESALENVAGGGARWRVVANVLSKLIYIL